MTKRVGSDIVERRMSPRDWAVAAVTAAGGVLLALGLIGLVSGGDDATPESIEQAAAQPTQDEAIEPEPSAPAEPEPSATPQPEPTSTATPEPAATPEPEPTATPTPEPLAETVEDFIVAFTEALAASDLDFVYARLHPVAFSIGGEDICRAYIDTEFSAASALRLNGSVEGPTEVVKVTPDGEVTVPERYTAEVTLTFQGQDFDVVGEYARVDGVMHWFSPCS